MLSGRPERRAGRRGRRGAAWGSGREPAVPPGCPVCDAALRGSARRHLPLTPALRNSCPAKPSESGQMILIKGRSREGFHSGKNCERVYDQV